MDILYSDNKIVVCVKPAGILSTDEPGGMPSLLRASLGPNCSVRSIHRLDQMTGGVMVYALSKHAAADLSAQIRNHTFLKTYYAVTHGIPALPSGHIRDWIQRDKSERKSYLVPEGTEKAQQADLDYIVVKSTNELALLQIELQTGRTHQIRCQLSRRQYPIVGDRKYGTSNDDCKMALWCYRISFIHPKTGKQMIFTAKVPDTYPWSVFGNF